MRRRLGSILRSTLMALPVLLAAPLLPARAQDLPVIKTLTLPLVYYAPYYAAALQGFDQKHGIKIELKGVTDGAQVTPALISGVADIIPCQFDFVALAREKGKSILSFYQLVDQVTLDLVVSNAIVPAGISHGSPIKDRFAVLKGHTFGYTDPGAPSDVFLRVALKDAGLDPNKDVDLVRVGSIAGLFAALKSKQIDGYMLSPPSPQQAEKSGAGQVLIRASAGELPSVQNFYFQNICSMSDYAAKYPERVQAYAAAVQDGNDWMRGHRPETIKMFLTMFPNVAADIWEAAYDLLLPTISKDGRFNPAEVTKTYGILTAGGVIGAMPDASENVSWTNRFLK